MATFTWINGSASWFAQAAWDSGMVPGAGDAAFIGDSGDYVVSLEAASSAAVAELALNNPGAVLQLDGTLAVTGGVQLFSGSLAVAGALSAGEIIDAAWLGFIGNHTLDAVPFTLANGGTLGVRASGGGATLTIGSNETITVMGGSNTIDSAPADNQAVVNQGTILMTFPGSSLTIAPYNFTNAGLISASAGAVSIGFNDGYIGGNRGPWSNTGTIALSGVASLILDGLVTTAGLGTMTGETDRVTIAGVLDNRTDTLNIGSGSALGLLSLHNAAVISGGTINDGGNGLNVSGGVYLDGVTYRGTLNFNNYGAVLRISNGLTAIAADGVGVGTINVTAGGYQILEFDGTQRFDNATINLDCSASFNPRVEVNVAGGYISTLTLGSNAVVRSSVAHTQAYIENAYQNYTALVNEGTIVASAAGGSMSILLTQGITNKGTILVSNGDAAQIAPGFDMFVNAAGALISVDTGSSLYLSTGGGASVGMSNAGTIALANGATLSLHGLYNYAALGNLINQGATVILDGGQFDLTGTTLTTGSGTELGAFYVSGGLQNGTILAGPGLHLKSASLQNDTVLGEVDVLTDYAYLTIYDGVTFAGADGTGTGVLKLTGANDTLSFGVNWPANSLTFDNATIVLGNNTGADTIAPGIWGGSVTFGPNASVLSDMAGGRAAFAIGAGTTVRFQGTLAAVAQGGTFTLSGQGTGYFGTVFYNDGTLLVGNGDTLRLTDAIYSDANTGTIEVGTHGTFDVGGTYGIVANVAANQILSFTDDTGVLILRQPSNFGASIAGFRSGDTIDLPGYAGVSVDWSAGTLDVFSSGGALLAALSLTGDYSGGNFFTAADAGGGSAITTSLPCFAAGTRLETARGPVAVEDLRAGDRLLTRFGGEQPIVWIGSRRVDCLRHPNPRRVLPVRVAAHAFAFGQPERALLLSPDHAVFVEDVLIPVKLLVNGDTIRQEQTAAITYYHVELERHDVLLAEGMPAESFLDTGNRAAFADNGAVIQLHPDFHPVGNIGLAWEARGCAPLVMRGAELERARAALRQQSDRLRALLVAHKPPSRPEESHRR